MSEGIITIRKGREKPIRNQHPWIFSGAIAKAENAEDGDIVTVLDQKGDFLARGYWNHKSQIQVRILTWQDEAIDEAWWRKMLKRAIDGRFDERVSHRQWERTPCRLVHAENDFLPGLIVDIYTHSDNSEWIVLQALTLGIDQRKQMLSELLQDILKKYTGINLSGIYERSDVDVRHKEGLSQHKGLLLGEEPPEYIQFEKTGSILVDIRNGHKTGLYLDQVDNWRLLHDIVNDYEGTGICHLLNLFSYTGGFTISASMMGGIHAVQVDASHDALILAEKNYELNSFHENKHGTTAEFIQADVFEYLRDCVERGDQYDIVVLDPPKFAHNKGQIDKASRGYKDINLNAFKIIISGGYLMTFSCSGAISRDLFQKIVFGALADSGRQAQIIKHLSASDDHPVALTFPEGEYLKGLLLRVY